MNPIDINLLILVGGLLILLGIASSKLSARLGLPVLVLFLVLGMLAGDEGPGGIQFADYTLSFNIGTLALAIIIFDGGLGTPLVRVKQVWKPAMILATVGVLITAVVTGVAAAWILDIPLLEGLLLGSIVGSTDAAAVFSVLRSGGTTLPNRIASTLEVESGSNDPMAVFLTIGCLEVLSGQMAMEPGIVGLFFAQMIIGALSGLVVGYLAVKVVNRINLEVAGLYPVLIAAFGLLIYGIGAQLGGSGFLAVYIGGIVIGNSRLVFQRGIRFVNDAGAWLAQIVMFILLGLLSVPSRLIEVAPQGLLIGVVLILLARPLAVIPLIFPFNYSWRELIFISWVGLKGAVPVVLATFPLLYGVPQASLIFDVVFFVVVLSAVVQGWTLPLAARWLGLKRPAPIKPPVTLEISSLRDVEGDVVDFTISEDSRAAGKRVKELALPEGAVIALIARGTQIIPPHGNTTIETGDHVILVLRPGILSMVSRIFASKEKVPDGLPPMLQFPLRPNVTIGQLEDIYGITLNAPSEDTLDEAIRKKLGTDRAEVDSVVQLGPFALHVRKVTPTGAVEQVAMTILDENGVALVDSSAQTEQAAPQISDV